MHAYASATPPAGVARPLGRLLVCAGWASAESRPVRLCCCCCWLVCLASEASEKTVAPPKKNSQTRSRGCAITAAPSGDGMGKKKKSEGYQVQLPGGSKAPLHNGDRGFFVRHVHTLRALEGSRFRRIRLTDQLQVGRRGSCLFRGDGELLSCHLVSRRDAACDAGFLHLTLHKRLPGLKISS